MPDITKNATQMLFQNTLSEVVRKLRGATNNEAEMIEQFLHDTKVEAASPVQSVKVIAVQKAAYFHMLGYSASYAAFNIVEVMADTIFAHKRIGYVAASTTFSEATEVIPLATALLRRDLASGNPYEAGLALYCLATICTVDLARDLMGAVTNLLNHPRKYVRKKAVLSLYKMFIQYPDSLRPTYMRLKQKIERESDHYDSDPAVQGAVVCVLCELARRHPANYLGLAVPLYAMLSNVHSNWTLIKLVKVFGYFAPLEPRLVKKLVEPLSGLINTTGAKSVLCECAFAVASGMRSIPALCTVVINKMLYFIEDPDQNLKYLGLSVLTLMMNDYSHLLETRRGTLFAGLDNADSTIRRKAMDILTGLVNKDNMVSTINHMLDRCIRCPPDEEWSNAVITAILDAAQLEDYLYVEDFEWYLGVLLDCCVMPLSTFEVGGRLEKELVTILTRVNGVRQYGVQALSQLLSNPVVLGCDTQHSSQWKVLCAAAFACGEYPHWLIDKRATCETLLSECIAIMLPEAQIACISAVGKIAAYVCEPCPRHVELCNGEEEQVIPDDPVTMEELVLLLTGGADDASSTERTLHVGLESFRRSPHPSVRETANIVYLLVTEHPHLGRALYGKPLSPIAAGAQEAVEVPDGLDLDEPFYADVAHLMPLTESDASEDDEVYAAEGHLEILIAQQNARERDRKAQMSAFYIKDTARSANSEDDHFSAADYISCTSPTTNDAPNKPSCFRPTHRENRRTFAINRELSKPSNYEAAAKTKRENSPEEDDIARRLRHIDVTRALAPHEAIPEVVPYGANSVPQGGNDARLADGLDGFPSVTLYDADLVRVVLYVDHCKVRKDGTHLKCSVEVVNVASSSTLHDVYLSIAYDDVYSTDALVLELATSPGHQEDAAVREDGSVLLSPRIRPTSTAMSEVVLRFADFPESFDTPLNLSLNYLKDKRPVTVSLPLVVQYVYFTKQPGEMSQEAFHRLILEKELADAPVYSAFVPCGRDAIDVAVPLLQRHLRLVVVDVLKDALSLYGALHGRKSALANTHIAVLLHETVMEGEKGMSISVRAYTPCMAQALIQAAVQHIDTAFVRDPH